MSEKTIIRIALALAILLGLWIGFGCPIPFIKVNKFSSSDDVPTFEAADPDDSDTERSNNSDRDFIGEEYNPEREREIDEMIEDGEERQKEMMEDE